MTGGGQALFLGGLTGVSLFTSVLLLLQLHALRYRGDVIDNAGMKKPLRDYDTKKIVCISLSTLGCEFLIFSAVHFSTTNRNILPYLIGALLGTIQLGVAVVFIHAFVVAVLPYFRGAPQQQFQFITWLAMSGGLLLINTLSTAFVSTTFNTSTPLEGCIALAVCGYTRVSVSFAQVFSIRAVSFPPNVQLESVELDNIPQRILALPLDSPPEQCPTTPLNIAYSDLGEAGHNMIKKKFTDFEVAKIYFDTYGQTLRVSTASESMRIHVTVFLRTILRGSTTWGDAIRSLPLKTQFNINRLRLGLGDTAYFDVRVHVPCEGEVLICIQNSSAMVSTFEELNNQFDMIRRDPRLLTLKWDERENETISANIDCLVAPKPESARSTVLRSDPHVSSLFQSIGVPYCSESCSSHKTYTELDLHAMEQHSDCSSHVRKSIEHANEVGSETSSTVTITVGPGEG
eukprot:CAMPEP_0185777288 /NCGR_PEP_ID=MMETSP1174-20130828/88930_1 /TAXON_ID=35687 /ORGANISM="Dictyocha speculum, Strain CCMP1381" /LENGTH=458 /DNA_ID=CAMNT_0028465603 /DNA_START=66 /DNA_END=1442 /DNA_ORIENTATION=-